MAYAKRRGGVTLTPEQVAAITAQIDISGKVDKETGKALLAITEAAKIHSLGSDNQDLSNLVGTDDYRLDDARNPTAHEHTEYEPINSNIQAHVTSAHAPATAQANADITKAEIEAKLTGSISTHTHAASGGLTQQQILRMI